MGFVAGIADGGDEGWGFRRVGGDGGGAYVDGFDGGPIDFFDSFADPVDAFLAVHTLNGELHTFKITGNGSGQWGVGSGDRGMGGEKWYITAMKWVALMVLSCGWAVGQKITVEFDERVNFGKFKTFAVRSGELNSRNPALNSDLTKKRITGLIEKYLSARGLEVTTGKSDLNVRFRLGTARHVETEAYPAGWRGLGTRVVRVPYTEGTLVIDLRDPSTRSLVWRGIAREEKDDPNKIEGKLDGMVRKAIEKYPPKGK